MKHTVTYSDAESIDPADVYHELCRARLYELGFRTVENAALMALKDCAGDDPKFIIRRKLLRRYSFGGLRQLDVVHLLPRRV